MVLVIAFLIENTKHGPYKIREKTRKRDSQGLVKALGWKSLENQWQKDKLSVLFKSYSEDRVVEHSW